MTAAASPETSDLAFASIPVAMLPRIEQAGLDTRALRLCLRPDDLPDDGARAVLVVRRAAAEQDPVIDPSDILNLSPFAPPATIEAGGGIVVKEDGGEREVLLIFRRGVWDLPKGKPEPGEPIDACALREVREEVGIEKLDLVAPAGTTVHGYREGDRFLIKSTWWFYMVTPERTFTPQREEDIEEVAWVSWDEALERLGHRNLRGHLRALGPAPSPP